MNAEAFKMSALFKAVCKFDCICSKAQRPPLRVQAVGFEFHRLRYNRCQKAVTRLGSPRLCQDIRSEKRPNLCGKKHHAGAIKA